MVSIDLPILYFVDSAIELEHLMSEEQKQKYAKKTNFLTKNIFPMSGWREGGSQLLICAASRLLGETEEDW